MKGLCFYFDKALPVMLLYKSERQQYADAIADDVSPSMVYGAEHLLRLFGNRCSIQFYATLVLIGGFMVFIPVLETSFCTQALRSEAQCTSFSCFSFSIYIAYFRHSTAMIRFLQKNQSAFYLSTNHAPEDSEGSTDKQEH
ncbi:hypothetical protein POTOM_008086 [Populus tomentosa]|uniref:MRG domain-containing protein n=1 Tax=Populus tomentosa TaxID=118781 RepID=A0A8X8AGU4_POPTO|nr:hypothetical protein POTOM_008086 [Populus tomentosa]